MTAAADVTAPETATSMEEAYLEYRKACALIVLSRRGGFKEGDRVVIRTAHGSDREGTLLHGEGGGRRWLVKLREEGVLGPGTVRPQPITAVVEVQQRTLNGFPAGDISLRRFRRPIGRYASRVSPFPGPGKSGDRDGRARERENQ